MTEYDKILKDIEKLPDHVWNYRYCGCRTCGTEPCWLSRQKLSENDHLVICISRTQGSAGNDIGFELADQLRINYYDVGNF